MLRAFPTFLLLCTLIFVAAAPIRAQDDGPAEAAQRLNAQLDKIIDKRKLAVALIPVTAYHGVDEAGYQSAELFPVASAFKGPVALYFFEHVDPTLWRSVPVRYWSAKAATNVPVEYQAAWNEHHAVLFDVYQMAVLSENEATARTLTYVWKNTAAKDYGANPVRAFNQWSWDRVGISKRSGLRAWLISERTCPRCYDDRLEAATLIYGRKIYYLNNTYTARDLALFWKYLALEGRQRGYFDAADALMQDQHYGLLGKTARTFGIHTISKDGYIAPNSDNGNGYRISTDGGLLRLPDGEEYAVAFLAFDSGDLIIPSAKAMSEMLIESQRAEF